MRQYVLFFFICYHRRMQGGDHHQTVECNLNCFWWFEHSKATHPQTSINFLRPPLRCCSLFLFFVFSFLKITNSLFTSYSQFLFVLIFFIIMLHYLFSLCRGVERQPSWRGRVTTLEPVTIYNDINTLLVSLSTEPDYASDYEVKFPEIFLVILDNNEMHLFSW